MQVVNNDIFKNNNVVSCHYIDKGVFIIEKKSGITHLSVKGNGNVLVYCKENGKTKQIPMIKEFNYTSPEGTCIDGIEIHVKEGRAEIIYKQDVGHRMLNPEKIFVRKRLLMLLKK